MFETRKFRRTVRVYWWCTGVGYISDVPRQEWLATSVTCTVRIRRWLCEIRLQQSAAALWRRNTFETRLLNRRRVCHGFQANDLFIIPRDFPLECTATIYIISLLLLHVVWYSIATEMIIPRRSHSFAGDSNNKKTTTTITPHDFHSILQRRRSDDSDLLDYASARLLDNSCGDSSVGVEFAISSSTCVFVLFYALFEKKKMLFRHFHNFVKLWNFLRTIIGHT